MADASAKRWMLVLFVIACTLRVGWVAVRYAGPERSQVLAYPDEEAYWLAARSLGGGHGLVDEFGFRATYMPAYPAFLAVFTVFAQPLFWARIGQAILASWVAPATYLLARRWASLGGTGTYLAAAHRAVGKPTGDAGHSIAIVAGGVVACDPFLVLFSGLLLTEALCAAALVTAWAVLLPMVQKDRAIGGRQIVGAGLLLFVCVMLRPSAIALVFAGPLALLVCRRFDRVGVPAAVLMVAIVFVGLDLWALRNQATIGQWRLLTTRGGISLYDGLQESATGASNLAHTKTLPAVAGLSEIEWDRHFRAEAWSAARNDPVRVLRLGWRKFLRTWSLVPNVATYRHGTPAAVSAAWMATLLAAAVIGWWFARRALAAWIMLLLPVVTVTLLHTVFVGSVRYRVPVMPMLIVLSAAGFVGIIERLKRSQAGGDP